MTLTAAEGPYLLRANVRTIVCSGVTVTCRAGTRIQADSAAELRVAGALVAQGTATAPVVFEPVPTTTWPGAWHGIEFRADGRSSRLTWTTVALAGGGDDFGAAVVCRGSTTAVPRPVLSHCTIAHSAGDGLRSARAAPSLSACTITGCLYAACRNVEGGCVDFTGPASSAAGNGSDSVDFDREGQAITFPQAWGPGLPYRLLGPVWVRAGGRLTLKAGLTLSMGPLCDLVAAEGPILAEGTGTRPITLCGVQRGRGMWGGIYVLAGGAPSVFRHCRISDAGRRGQAVLCARGARRDGGVALTDCDFFRGLATGVYLEDSVATIRDSTLRQLSGWGVVTEGDTTLSVSGTRLVDLRRDGVYNASWGSVTFAPDNVLLRIRGNLFSNLGPRSVDARGCYWGADTAVAIDARIYDSQDNRDAGRVLFEPFLTAAPGAEPAGFSPVLAITSAGAVPSARGVRIVYVLTSSAHVRAEIVNPAGRLVRVLHATDESHPGLNALWWDARSASGLDVPCGAYLIRLRAAGPRGARAEALASLVLTAR
jgi:hypothetical protein